MKAGICCFAWDFSAQGPDKMMGWAADAGLSYLAYAGTYHAGWFLHPHNAHCRTRLTSSALYFQPQRDLYGTIQPIVAAECYQIDWMREVGKRLDQYDLELYSWTIGTHNTALGALYSDLCVRNAFGDVYPAALCPAHSNVRHYLLALCRDLSQNLPVSALILESFGYEGWKHGHHHERDLTGLSPIEARLMNICFHPATMRNAERFGIDSEAVRQAVKTILSGAFESAPHRAAGHPQSWDDVLTAVPELQAYLDANCTVEESIVHEIKTICKARGVELRSYIGPRPETIDDYDAVRTHGATPLELIERAKTVRQLWPTKKLCVDLGITPVTGPKSLHELKGLVAAAREANADELHFYNYSEASKTTLRWLAEALKQIG